MALLPILTLPDPRLRLLSKPVERVDAAILKILDDMLETMYEAPGVGLAAIQVGHAKRMVTIDVTKKEEGPRAPLFLINPQIVWTSEELSSYNEGCLSVPDYFEDVQRPARVRVRHIDRQGSEQEFEAEGLLATVVQHRARPSRRRTLHRSSLAAETRARRQEVQQGCATCCGASVRGRMTRMRVVFMGTPVFATGLLQELHERGHEIVAVYTQPPRPAGRGMELKKSPVHLLAESLGLKVSTPKSLRSKEEQAAFAALAPTSRWSRPTV